MTSNSWPRASGIAKPRMAAFRQPILTLSSIGQVVVLACRTRPRIFSVLDALVAIHFCLIFLGACTLHGVLVPRCASRAHPWPAWGFFFVTVIDSNCKGT